MTTPADEGIQAAKTENMAARIRTRVGGMHVTKVARHRNGIGGEPFYVVLFHLVASPECPMIATVFDGPGAVAVLARGQVASGDIDFGVGSYRGDIYEPALRSAIEEHEAARADENLAATIDVASIVATEGQENFGTMRKGIEACKEAARKMEAWQATKSDIETIKNQDWKGGQ